MGVLMASAWAQAQVRAADVFVQQAAGRERLVVRLTATSPGRPFLVLLTLPAGAVPEGVDDGLFEALAAVIDPPPVDVDPRPRARIARPTQGSLSKPPPLTRGRLGVERIVPLPPGLPPAPPGFTTVVIEVHPVAAEGDVGPLAWSFPAEVPVLPPLPVSGPILVFVDADGPLGLAGAALRQVPRAELDERATAPRPVRLFAGSWEALEADHRLTALDERDIPAALVPEQLGTGVLSVLWGQPEGGRFTAFALDKNLNHPRHFDLQQRGPRDDRGALRLEGPLAAPEDP